MVAALIFNPNTKLRIICVLYLEQDNPHAVDGIPEAFQTSIPIVSHALSKFHQPPRQSQLIQVVLCDLALLCCLQTEHAAVSPTLQVEDRDRIL